MTRRLTVPLVLAAIAALSLASCRKEEPKPPASATEAAESPAAVTPVTAENWLADHFAPDVRGDTGELLYARADADLDGDGKNEVLAYVGGPLMCGTGGCNLVVLKRDGDGFRQVGDLSVVQLPVGVLPTKTNGWRDLAVTVSGGGKPGGLMRVPFDGTSYASNPTVSPAEPVESIGEAVIKDEPLKPLNPAG
ncbi:MAG TPA: hypothetical protein VJQ77_11065 [Novosphingobium sp.]|nr:hypothetical protein [Novosphingobium sp.]